MTTLNNDTITLSDSMYQSTSIPAFDSSTLSSYLNGMSITSAGCISASGAGDTITINQGMGSGIAGQMYYNTISNSTYVHTGTASGWAPINGTHEWSIGEDFIDKFPEWNAFRKLCEDYPGLEKAYQNLKTFYTMCYADSILPKDDK